MIRAAANWRSPDRHLSGDRAPLRVPQQHRRYPGIEDGLDSIFTSPVLGVRGRTGGQKAKITARQARIARDMYEETDPDGRRVHTVAQIAAEFGVTRPTIYRHLANLPTETPPSR